MPLLFVIGRILLGGYFLMNGYNHFKNLEGNIGYAKSKGVAMPKLAVGFTGLLLLVGGASIVTGFVTNVGIAVLILFLIPVTFQMHAFWKESDPMKRMGEKINFQKNIALLGAVLMMLALDVPWLNSI